MLLLGLLIGLFISSAIFLYLYQRPQTEPPEGVIITHDSRFGWNYILDDHRGMYGIGYLTRGAAIRAATTELERLKQKDALQ
jgi:hypothetical protein